MTPGRGELLETAEFLEGTADAHGLAMHNGKLISCDAGVGPPGFRGHRKSQRRLCF